MVVIFGWGSGEAQDLGEVAPVICPNCHNDVFLHDIRSDKRVSLYFVPLASYGSDEYLACPICRHGLQIQQGRRPAVDRMRAATTLYRRGQLHQDYYRSQVDQFWRLLGVAPSGQQVLHPAATIPPPPGQPAAPGATVETAQGEPPGTPSFVDQLQGYAKLHADGVLTDDEFAAVKRRLLGIEGGG